MIKPVPYHAESIWLMIVETDQWRENVVSEPFENKNSEEGKLKVFYRNDNRKEV